MSEHQHAHVEADPNAKTFSERGFGGYIEFESYAGSIYHDSATALNTARNGLAYLIESKGISSILLPDYLCDSVEAVCVPRGVTIRYYSIGADFRPLETPDAAPDEWLYIVNYFGQLSNTELRSYRARYPQLVLDNTQAFFSAPLDAVDTIYTCRKFFGVPDGAFLYSDVELGRSLPSSSSAHRMGHILGRFEGQASDFYADYRDSEQELVGAPVAKMSSLTENLMRGVRFDDVAMRRRQNFTVLHSRLHHFNDAQVTAEHSVPFMYPLLVEDGPQARAALQKARVYVPTLWPNVIDQWPETTISNRLAQNLLPLPLDQRYSEDDMTALADLVEKVVLRT